MNGIKKEVVFTVDYHQFEDFINKSYGTTNYDIVSIEELSNDTSKSYSVKKEELEEYDKKDLQEFLDKGYKMYITQVLLQDLCNRDLLEEGTYIINISW